MEDLNLRIKIFQVIGIIRQNFLRPFRSTFTSKTVANVEIAWACETKLVTANFLDKLIQADAFEPKTEDLIEQLLQSVWF